MGRGRHCRGNKAEAGRPDRSLLIQLGGGEQSMVAQARVLLEKWWEMVRFWIYFEYLLWASKPESTQAVWEESRMTARFLTLATRKLVSIQWDGED